MLGESFLLTAGTAADLLDRKVTTMRVIVQD